MVYKSKHLNNHHFKVAKDNSMDVFICLANVNVKNCVYI